jgi:hypothetical protein
MSWRRNFSTTPSVVIFRYYSVYSSRLRSTGLQYSNSVQRHLWSSSGTSRSSPVVFTLQVCNMLTFVQRHLWSSSDTSQTSPVVFTLQVRNILILYNSICGHLQILLGLLQSSSLYRFATYLLSTTPSVVIFRYYSVFSSRLHSTGLQHANFLSNAICGHLQIRLGLFQSSLLYRFATW